MMPSRLGALVYSFVLIALVLGGIYLAGWRVYGLIAMPSEKQQHEAIWTKLTDGKFNSYQNCVRKNEVMTLDALKYCREWYQEVTFFIDAIDAEK